MQGCDPQAKPLTLTDLVAINAVKLFFFLCYVILICHIIYLRRPQLPLVEIENVHYYYYNSYQNHGSGGSFGAK